MVQYINLNYVPTYLVDGSKYTFKNKTQVRK